MTDKQLEQVMRYVIKQIKNEGYNPFIQLQAYLATGNDAYITRTGHARELVEEMDNVDIKKYLNQL